MKTELISHKPFKKELSEVDKKELERAYNRGMSLTTAKTLDKNLRRVGVLDVELRNLDLNRLPTIDFQDTDAEEFKVEVHHMCKSIKFWLFDEKFDVIFKQIDQSKDGKLSIDEVHRW